jgi:dihydrofolate reductase
MTGASATSPSAAGAVSCKVFVATSLDGFIARTDGRIDWLEEASAAMPSGEDCGYADFLAGIDVLVIRRLTFEQALAFPAWPYGDRSVVVLSRTMAMLPEGLPSSVRLSSAAPPALVAELAAQGLGRVYVDGGQVIGAFLAAGLVDEITVTVVPVLLGGGRALFAPGPQRRLSLVKSRAWPFGFFQGTWRVEPQRTAI